MAAKNSPPPPLPSMDKAAFSPIALPSFFSSDRLRCEIFSLLESNFLFGAADGCTPPTSPARGKVRILSIDGLGGHPRDALSAAAALVKLESALRAASGDADAVLADFFDITAGSGAGGVLAVLIFLRRRFTAEDVFSLVASSARRGRWGKKLSFLAGLLPGSSSFRQLFGDLTLKDTVKPVVIPCYDAATAAPFVFSRADAVESDGYDFYLSDVCRATCAGAGGRGVVGLKSVDRWTEIAAVGGAAVTGGNPTAAAITHVMHNKQEFPLVAGVEDLFVLSIGTGEAAVAAAGGSTSTPLRSPTPAAIARITAAGVADMVDQAVAMAFAGGGGNYVRIQAGDGTPSPSDPKNAAGAADRMLLQRNVESVLFRGRKLSEKTNAEKLELAGGELVQEQNRRAKCAGAALPTVVIKDAATPRMSSASSGTTAWTAASSSSPAATATPSPAATATPSPAATATPSPARRRRH